MDYLDSLIERNQAFPAQGFSADPKIIPSKKTFIIGCVDPPFDQDLSEFAVPDVRERTVDRQRQLWLVRVD